MAGSLFAYGAPTGHGVALHDLPYVVVDLETTGLADDEDRIVEIAMVRVEDGRPVDEWASLIDPERDPGPTFIHRITAGMLVGAPTFRDVVGEILARLDGAIVVAHNATFEEKFLAAEFARLGITTAPMPALCTLLLARSALAAPNHRLDTCCTVAGVGLSDAHTALGDTRATARLLPALLSRVPAHTYPARPQPLPRYQCLVRPRTRASKLRKGEEGWMRSLLTKLPMSMSDADPAGADAYVFALGEALADGTLTGDEARQLGRLAGRAGMGATQVAELNHRFLDGLRDAALADDVLTSAEHRQLTAAANLLNVPGYFADLVPTTDDAAGPFTPKPRGQRVWCSPGVPSVMRARLDEAGFVRASNVTRNLVAAVTTEPDSDHPRVRRAIELGIRIVDEHDIDQLLHPDDQAVAPAEPPAESAKRRVPAGWYADPSGRTRYRYWNSASWTDQASDADGLIWSDTMSLPLTAPPTFDGQVDGREPHTYAEAILGLAASDPHAALNLCLRCIDANENTARRTSGAISPWFYEHAVDLLTRLQRPHQELVLLERLAAQPHTTDAVPQRLLDRLSHRRRHLHPDGS